jgi:HSP20 family protein
MDTVRTVKMRWVLGLPGNIEFELPPVWVARPTPMWEPAMNAYRCEDCIRICVELAGVDRAEIDLRLEPKRITLRGRRDVPEKKDWKGETVQMLMMEIDYGFFERTIRLPAEIEVNKAHAEQENGLLWISLPLKKS